MIKKQNIFIVLIFICHFYNHLQGQINKLNLSLNAGIASTNMSDYKLFIKQGKFNLPVDTKTFGNFAPSPYLSYSFSLSFNNGFFLGLGNGLYSNWARLHYRDYSGEYKLDMEVDGFSIHLRVGGTEQIFRNINLEFYGKPELLFATTSIDESISIYEFEEVYSESYKYTQLMGEAGIDMVVFTNKSIKPFIGLAYSGLLFSSKNEDIDPPQWSGIRAGIGVRFSIGIGSHKNDQEELKP